MLDRLGKEYGMDIEAMTLKICRFLCTLGSLGINEHIHSLDEYYMQFKAFKRALQGCLNDKR